MDLQWDQDNLRIKILAQTDREHRLAAPVVEYGRVVLVLLAILNVVFALISGTLNLLTVLLAVSSFTAISKVHNLTADLSATAEMGSSLTRTKNVTGNLSGNGKMNATIEREEKDGNNDSSRSE